MTTEQKLISLRKLMKTNKLDAYIIPSTDPHISEYVPEKYKSREWVSGFSGSVATLVITQDHAGLWTDGRYFLQAEKQLSSSEFVLHKLGVPGHKDYPEWLNNHLPENSTVGLDGFVFSTALVENLKENFSLKSISIDSNQDLINDLWLDRPELPKNKIFIHNDKYSGQTVSDKIKNIRSGLKSKNCDSTIICSLDDIAWILNLRGRDIPFNPVVVSFLIITSDSVSFFIDSEKLTDEITKYLKINNIDTFNYKDVESHILSLNNNNILIDPVRSNFRLFDLIPSTSNVVKKQNISTLLKSIKNEIEIEGMKKAMEFDLIAMIKFQFWLEKSFTSLTEIEAAKKLNELRAKNNTFYGDSFNYISGMGENGAIIHYSPNESSNAKLTDETFYLMDSGGQYYEGTTDITRMYHLGKPSSQEIRDYTLVLKGMINLTLQKFPIGTRGGQLDILARQFLWNNALDYNHGTGHGVGCFMNVHEGPQNIRKEHNPTELVEGMILSNEPGVYRASEYGIRIENLILVKKITDSKFNEFLGFETLTLCPIELKTVDRNLLSNDEINWLNNYHQLVYETAQNSLDDETKEWLKIKTRAI
ncbi:aminopeptidase P family protein [Candidatus Kapabacteria bacterium]|nr:aminopeptidase P family protein [Candidatus Kapabacteria bacterium]